jgi:hypothetical protein
MNAGLRYIPGLLSIIVFFRYIYLSPIESSREYLVGVNIESLYLPWIISLVSTSMFFIIHFICEFYYKDLNTRDSSGTNYAHQYADQFVSLVHSAYAAIANSILLIWMQYNGVVYQPLGDPDIPACITAVTLGFFIWDLYNQIVYPGINSNIYTIHAVIGTILSACAVNGYLQAYSSVALLAEISTIFLNLIWFQTQRSKLYGEPLPKSHMVFKLLFFSTFIITRLILFPIYSMIPVQQAISHIYSLYDLHAPIFNYFGFSKIIVSYTIFYSVSISNLCLIVLNTHWGWLLILKFATLLRSL